MKTPLEDYIRCKIADVEKAIKFREENARCFRSGTNAEWDAVADSHPTTAGKYMPKKDRMETAAIQDRIAAQNRRELEILQPILQLVKGK